MLPFVDDFFVIACALTNLGSPILAEQHIEDSSVENRYEREQIQELNQIRDSIQIQLTKSLEMAKDSKQPCKSYSGDEICQLPSVKHGICNVRTANGDKTDLKQVPTKKEPKVEDNLDLLTLNVCGKGFVAQVVEAEWDTLLSSFHSQMKEEVLQSPFFHLLDEFSDFTILSELYELLSKKLKKYCSLNKAWDIIMYYLSPELGAALYQRFFQIDRQSLLEKGHLKLKKNSYDHDLDVV